MRRIGYPSISTSVVGVNKFGPGSIIEPVASRKSGECSNGNRMSFAFFQTIGEKGQAAFLYIIGTMLVVSWLAEVIGIEAIIGAFLAGLTFNSLPSNKGPLKNRLESIGDAFVTPLSLISGVSP